LSTPKILFCPSDNIHSQAATNFTYQNVLMLNFTSGNVPAQAGETSGDSSKISYFINGDATEANPQDIMTGDDNIGNNGATSASAVAGYRFGASGSGSQTIATALLNSCCQSISSTAFSGSPWWSWTANDFHQKSGNLGLADGSCQGATITGLHQYLANSTNSAAYETINFMP
jgi:hypothetical protein